MYFFVVFDLGINLKKKYISDFIMDFVFFRLQHLFPVLTNTTPTFKTNPMSRLKQMHIHPGHSTNLSLIYLRSMWLCAPVFVLSDNVFAQYCQQNSHVLDIYCILF